MRYIQGEGGRQKKSKTKRNLKMVSSCSISLRVNNPKRKHITTHVYENLIRISVTIFYKQILIHDRREGVNCLTMLIKHSFKSHLLEGVITIEHRVPNILHFAMYLPPIFDYLP